jgi:SHS2 domain-containing protein
MSGAPFDGPRPCFEFVEGATGDLAFEARGPTPEAVFAASAEALLAATVEEPDRIGAGVRRSLALAEPGLDLLLLRCLNELVYLRDAERLLMRIETLRIERDGDWRLTAELSGEAIDPARHRLEADVKAATAHGLFIGNVEGRWEARVTLDV